MITFTNVQVLEFLAKLTSGILTGSDSHLLLIELPSMIACESKGSIEHFNKMSVKSGALQIITKTMGIGTCLAVFYIKRERKYLYSASLSLSMLFYTPIALGTINMAMRETKNDKESNETKLLLSKWNRIHAVRTLVDFLAFSLLIF